jgi:hypothetical protein
MGSDINHTKIIPAILFSSIWYVCTTNNKITCCADVSIWPDVMGRLGLMGWSEYGRANNICKILLL